MRQDIDFAAHIEAVARRLCGEPNKHLSHGNELRFGSHGSLSVLKDKGTWFDHENKTGGGVIDLLRHKLGLPNGEAVDWLRTEIRIDEPTAAPPRAARRMHIVETYDYQDEQGDLLFQVCRLDPKDFRQRRPDGRGGWEWSTRGVRQVPYRLPELAAADPGRTVFIVEGERDVERLIAIGLIATCNPGGAGKWRAEFAAPFSGRSVVVLPDNDDAGRAHAQDIVRSLLPVTHELRVVELPDLSPKGDVSDWLDAGGSREALIALVSTAEPAPPNVVRLRAVESEPKADDDAPGLFDAPLNDLGNAARLIARHEAALRYVVGVGWYVWDGKRYQHDPAAVAARALAHDTARAMLTAAVAIQAHTKEQGSRQKALFKFSVGSGNASKTNNMLSQAEPELAMQVDGLDRDPWLLNCQNGTIDLRTGDLRDHSRDDLISKICGTHYDPQAKCPRWEKFLSEIFDDNTAIVEFMQRALGYSLTGMTTEQMVFIMHGSGSNGKSVLLETLATIMQDYNSTSSADTWVAKREGAPTNDIARLAGSRFVSVVETEHGKHLAESLVKRATGGDKMSARFLYKEDFEFTPVFKLWFATNHKPNIRGSEFAIWRRIMLIAFNVTFNDENKISPGQKVKDPHLKDTLVAEHPGILAWLVRGCVAWRERGLAPPPDVINATESYQDSQDNVSAFIRDNCYVSRGQDCKIADLYRSYEQWCADNDEEPLTSRMFGRNLDDRGYPPGKRKAEARLRHGIDLTKEARDALSPRS